MLSRNEAKYIQSLGHKKNRDNEGCFVAEGVKVVDELIQSGFAIRKIYALKKWAADNSDIKDVIEVDEAGLKRISNFETPNKVIAVFEKKKLRQSPDFNNKITLVLDGIQDPGNLGTIIRTADWFGIENIIASPDTADIYNAKVVQSTMGSIARVNMIYTDLDGFLYSNKIPVYGAMLDGEAVSAIKKTEECFVIIGNEGKGIRENIQPYIQKKISIPKIGNAESLNAAVATGIILYSLKIKI
ncbi:TrmH family RNA methyltransferase [Parafilimonas terrae]|uniref:RNA methyltransferase, TrmH family n=1 Tax=Parafilimonas terrae TaxID=1465490 RepID=A0A1I5UHX6_9BACT|nr:RNA methyltransferase [Parafilimonas terrae]SFP94830.1 RNA methyltransferase, TrmH family [Parafilimonas terrae]